MTIEIVGAKLDLSIKELKVKAIKTHETKQDWLGTLYQVWELSDEEYNKLNNPLIKWKKEYGWWRNSGCNSTGKSYEFIVNNKSMIGFVEEYHYLHDPEYYGLDEEDIPQIKFKNLYEYLDGYIGVSNPENYTYFIHSLAELNGIKKSEMFELYW